MIKNLPVSLLYFAIRKWELTLFLTLIIVLYFVKFIFVYYTNNFCVSRYLMQWHKYTFLIVCLLFIFHKACITTNKCSSFVRFVFDERHKRLSKTVNSTIKLSPLITVLSEPCFIFAKCCSVRMFNITLLTLRVQNLDNFCEHPL